MMDNEWVNLAKEWHENTKQDDVMFKHMVKMNIDLPEEVVTWLQENFTYGVDYIIPINGLFSLTENNTIMFKNKSDAIQFKLVWG